MEQEIKTDQVEQLWYTWSTVGLDQQALAAGFRVRAASPGLTDLYNERMKQLDRYLRYSLPPGADPLRTRPFNPQSIRIQEDAPISLTFARIESGERILIHKVYTGKDGRGRPGAYFAHLLAPLPTDFFSARDAIRLWRYFSFWHTSDVSGQVQGTTLSDISLAIPHETTLHAQPPARALQLRSSISVPSPEDHTLIMPKISFENIHALNQQFVGVPLEQGTTNTNAIDEDLRFVIQAYLLRRKAIEDQKKEREDINNEIEKGKERIGKLGRFSTETKQLKLMIEEKEGLLYVMGHQEPPRIYIAAPPDRVAYLIAGLTRLLPRQFLQDMTFSTYEDDVLTKLPLDIVGTCKPPVSLDHSTAEDDILPPACYQKGFVLNTYLREKNTPLSHFTSHSTELDPREANEHARIIIDSEEYARFVVDELREVMLEDRPAAYQKYTILTPIKEVDDMFKELGDIPEKSLQELPALSVSDLLTEYTTSKQMPLREITSFLKDPLMALLRLKKRMFRKQLFVRTYHDPSQEAGLRDDIETQEDHLIWLQSTLPDLLANLRAKSDDNLNTQLEKLAKEAVVEIYKATSSPQEDLTRFLTLFIPLKRLESVPLRQPEPMTTIWDDLLSRCCNDLHSQYFINQHWEAREKLLEIAIEVLEPNDSRSQFLLTVETIQFGKLLLFLQKREPGYFDRQIAPLSGVLSARDKVTAWLHQTVLCFLQQGQPSSSTSAISKSLLYDSNTIQQLETDFNSIKFTFEHLLNYSDGKQPQWHDTAQSLLLALVNSGYEHQSRYRDRYKMELLAIWFADAHKRKELPTFLADSVPLSVTELERLLTTYGEAIQQRASRNKTIARLFWRLIVMMSPQKMEIAFQLLDRYVNEDKFNGLLNPREFEIYTSKPEFAQVLKPYLVRVKNKPQFLNAEESHIFLKHYSDNYRDEQKLILISSYMSPKKRRVPDVFTIYINQHNNEVHTLLMKNSYSYQSKIQQFPSQYTHQNTQEVYTILLAHSLQFFTEIYTILTNFCSEKSEEVHNLLMLQSTAYKDEQYSLPLAASSPYINEVQNILINLNEIYNKEVLSLLTRYVTYYNDEVHSLLSLYAPQYKNILYNFIMKYVDENTEEVQDLLTYYSSSYIQEMDSFLRQSSPTYASELEQLYAQSTYSSQPQKVGENRHQYAIHYPNASIWQYILSTFQAERHIGRIPLVYTIIQAASQAHDQLMTKDELEHYLTSACLSDDEYVTILHRFGPDMLTAPALAPLVPQYYKRRGCSDDFTLLLNLLDTKPDAQIANQLLALSTLDHARIVRYFTHYSQIYPPFCYRLQAAYTHYKKLSWEEIQPLIPAWLEYGMTDKEIEMTLGQNTFLLKELDHSLTEKYAQRYLTKYPASNVFLTLCQYYLQTFDAKMFERRQGKALLHFLHRLYEKQQPSANFWDLTDLITTWYIILQFIEHPTSQQNQLLNIFSVVYNKVSTDQRPEWIASIAKAQVTCLEDAGQLGSTISSLCIINSNEAIEYLEAMIKRIHDERSNTNHFNESWLRRTTLFLEFLFLPDLLTSLSEERRNNLISTLLENMSQADQDFIQKQAAFWSPDAKKMARDYRINPYKKSTTSATSSSAPSFTVSETQPTLPLTAPDTTANPVAMPETPFLAGIRKSFYAWLIFPWLFLRLWSLQRKGGVDRLAYFWLNNKEALEKSRSLTPPTWKRHLQFACRFQTLCWESANSSTPIEADKELLDVINTNMYQRYLAQLTASEKWRILLAVKRTASPLPKFLTLSAPSDKQEEQKTGSDEQEPVVNQQPPAQKATTKGTKKGKFSKNKGSK